MNIPSLLNINLIWKSKLRQLVKGKNQVIQLSSFNW